MVPPRNQKWWRKNANCEARICILPELHGTNLRNWIPIPGHCRELLSALCQICPNLFVQPTQRSFPRSSKILQLLIRMSGECWRAGFGLGVWTRESHVLSHPVWGEVLPPQHPHLACILRLQHPLPLLPIRPALLRLRWRC
jgi:hypothetical protein